MMEPNQIKVNCITSFEDIKNFFFSSFSIVAIDQGRTCAHFQMFRWTVFGRPESVEGFACCLHYVRFSQLFETNLCPDCRQIGGCLSLAWPWNEELPPTVSTQSSCRINIQIFRTKRLPAGTHCYNRTRWSDRCLVFDTHESRNKLLAFVKMCRFLSYICFYLFGYQSFRIRLFFLLRTFSHANKYTKCTKIHVNSRSHKNVIP